MGGPAQKQQRWVNGFWCHRDLVVNGISSQATGFVVNSFRSSSGFIGPRPAAASFQVTRKCVAIKYGIDVRTFSP
jgi:hypothetical protein